MGEGWLLTAEMLELIHSGTNSIVCAQPFGCLPNHIVGKGMIRRLKDDYPRSNIVAIDYDPGATKINQENRIKLCLPTRAAWLARKPASRGCAPGVRGGMNRLGFIMPPGFCHPEDIEHEHRGNQHHAKETLRQSRPENARKNVGPSRTFARAAAQNGRLLAGVQLPVGRSDLPS
jgi:hypothetical protein